MGIYLKIPMAGYRYYNGAIVINSGSNGYYWSSTPYDANRSYIFYFYSSGITPQFYDYRANGYSVRCFKNEPINPISN